MSEVGEGVEPVEPDENEDPRQYCVFPVSGSLNYNYPIGCLTFEAVSGPSTETRRVSVVCVSVVDNKLLVAIPFSCWHRLVRERKLPPNSFSKAVSLAVGASLEDRREEVVEGVFIKCWLGFISTELEACITFQEQTESVVPFLTEDHEDGFIPCPEALVTIADEKFSFVSLESGGPQDHPSPPVADPNRRLAALEEAMIGMKQGIQSIMDRLEKPEEKTPPKIANPKVVPAKPRAEESGVPGLDPQVVKSALQSGVDRSQLEQLGRMMGRFGGKNLGDAPATKKRLDPLGEEIEPVDVPDQVEEAEVVPSDPMTHALVKLTNIVDALAANKQKKPRSLAELLDESLYVGESSSSSSQLTSTRRHSAVLKALRKALTDSPSEVYSCIESRMLQDFGAPEAGPGQPDSGGTFRGWAEHRSHVPAIAGTVRILWAICGALDALKKGKVEEGKARLALLVASIDQVAVDRGSWILAAEGLLEESPPIVSFSRHQPPRNDGVAAYKAVGCDLGRSVHAQDQRNRRLCGEAPETRPERSEASYSRCCRPERKGEESKRGRSRKGSLEPASRGGKSCDLKEQCVSPPGGADVPGVFRDDKIDQNEPSLAEPKLQVPRSLPGSRASSVHPRGWWLASFRLASQLGGSFSCFIRSFHRRLATPPVSVGTASLWPMPLPFVSEMRDGVKSELPEIVPMRRGVNMVVLVLNWLYLRRPKTCPAEICLGARLNRLQWRVVRNLERLLEAWNSTAVIDASCMGRSASKIENMEEVVWKLAQFEKSASDWLDEIAPSTSDNFKGSSRQFVHAPGLQRVSAGEEVGELPSSDIITARPIVADRLNFRDEPRFDPGPFLDSRGKAVYFDPINSASSPADLLIDPPVVRIHASEEEKWKLYKKLDAGKRLGIVPFEDALPGFQAGLFSVLKSSDQDRLIFDSRPFNCLEEECGPWSSSMASASNLLDIQLDANQVLRTSCTDLRDFYYAFKVNYQRLRRNTLIGLVPFGKLRKLECAKGMQLSDDHLCYLSLRSLAMGDSHAVELAQTCHLGILIQSGLLTADRFISMNLAIPRSPKMVGVIIDDLVLFEKILRENVGELGKDSWGATSMQEALQRYEQLGLVPHLGKNLC